MLKAQGMQKGSPSSVGLYSGETEARGSLFCIASVSGEHLLYSTRTSAPKSEPNKHS